MSQKRSCNDAELTEIANPCKKIKLNHHNPLSNVLQFDSSSTQNINENLIKYRQRVLSQLISETTNSNSVLEWENIEFPGTCCDLSISPNERFIVAQYGDSMFNTHTNLGIYDLSKKNIFEYDTVTMKLDKFWKSFYWLNDQYLSIKYNENYTTNSFEICLLDVIHNKCYLIQKNMVKGQLFAVNNQQFILIGAKEIECYNISTQTEPTNTRIISNVLNISLKPYRTITFDFSINSGLICDYQQCIKLQWIRKNKAAIIMPIFPSVKHAENVLIEIYLFDLTTFKYIDMKCDTISNIDTSFDGNSLNGIRFCFNKINTDWNWTNDNTFFAVHDTERTQTCNLYTFNIDYDDGNYSMKCKKLPEISKEGGGEYNGEKPQWLDPHLMIHPLSRENILIQRYSKYVVLSYGDYTSPWDKDDYEVKQWHQCTKINNNHEEMKRYKYYTYRGIIVDVVSGMLFVESKFIHQSKKEYFNAWTMEMEKPCTYGLDVRDSLNGDKIGFIAIPQLEIDECNESNPAHKKFCGNLDSLQMIFGLNCLMMNIKGSKYGYLLKNMHSPKYWSDILNDTKLFAKHRVIADITAQFLCY